MAIRWIDEPCQMPGMLPPGVPVADAYYGSGVMPVTTRPPWLRDSGGVAPGLIAGPGTIGQNAACDAYKARLPALQASCNALRNQLVEAQAAALEAAQAGDQATAVSLTATANGIRGALADCQNRLNELNNAIANCQNVTPPPPLPPPPSPVTCTETTGCDFTTQDCFNGSCVDKCPSGQKRGTDGSCVPAVTKAGVSSGGAWAIALLALAAVGAIFLGRPGMDAEELA